MSAVRARSYCFTINNWTDDDAYELQALCDHPRLKYFIAGKEQGKEGTPHIQGYCQFRAPVAFQTIKKLITRAHIEIAEGTPEQNITYCSKEGDYIEHGERPLTKAEQGARGAQYWSDQLALCKSGRIDECDAKLVLTHYKTLKSIADDYAHDLGNDYCPHVYNYWLYGPTRTGKSRAARAAFKHYQIYSKMCNKWWDNYKQEKAVLIEDFDKTHHILGHHLKIWADSYPFRGEVKNSTKMLRPLHIIVTSNYHPKEIWPDDPGILSPILARFRIVEFPIPVGQVFDPKPHFSPPPSPPATLPLDDEQNEYFEKYCPHCAISMFTSGDHLKNCPLTRKLPTPAHKKCKKPFQ